MAVYGGVMVYSGTQRSGELGIPFSDSPAFSTGWSLPGQPCSYLNPLLSPTETDQTVQGKLVVCSCYIFQPVPSTFPPPSALWEGDATWQKTIVLITMQCTFQMPSSKTW